MVTDVCSKLIASALDSIREEGTRDPTLTVERIMNEDDVELINGTELTISLLDTDILEDSTRKKGSLLPEYNSREEKVLVEFFISVEALDTRILH